MERQRQLEPLLRGAQVFRELEFSCEQASRAFKDLGKTMNYVPDVIHVPKLATHLARLCGDEVAALPQVLQTHDIRLKKRVRLVRVNSHEVASLVYLGERLNDDNWAEALNGLRVVAKMLKDRGLNWNDIDWDSSVPMPTIHKFLMDKLLGVLDLTERIHANYEACNGRHTWIFWQGEYVGVI